MKTLTMTVIVMLLTACSFFEDEKKLQLKVLETSCTEVWLKVTGETGKKITLIRDEEEVETFTLTSSPQTFRDDFLGPYTTYKYKVEGYGQTSAAEATTLDTTGNNFTWQSWNFGGDLGGGRLYDAAIINENDIWAVGDIFIADTSENGYTTYNAVHWDGNEWELKRIKTNACGGVEYPSIEAIYVFTPNNILFAHADGSITYYNGEEFINDCSLITTLNGSARNLWGKSKNNFYVASSYGFIAHYNGTTWNKIETGTDLPFGDIYGAENSATGKVEILAVCNRNYPSEKHLYKIEGNTVTEISQNIPGYQDADIDGLWFVPNRHYYIVGSGIYKKKSLDEDEWTGKPLDISRYAMSSIRSNGLNDIFCVGAYGEVLHFNGVRWQSFIDDTGITDGAYNNVEVKGNIVVATGGDGQQAKILIGKR